MRSRIWKTDQRDLEQSVKKHAVKALCKQRSLVLADIKKSSIVSVEPQGKSDFQDSPTYQQKHGKPFLIKPSRKS